MQGRRRRYCHYCHGSTFCRDTKAVGTPIPSIKKKKEGKIKKIEKKKTDRDKETKRECQRYRDKKKIERTRKKMDTVIDKLGKKKM